MNAWDLLTSLDLISLIALFWYAIIFEFPRYAIGAIVVAFGAPRSANAGTKIDLTFSVLLVGHNEAKCLRKCVECLAEQTIAKTCGRMHIVVVDDGSTDGMIDIALELQ